MGVLALLTGCASGGLREDLVRPPADFALAPAETGTLAEIASSIVAEYGEDHSGFRILDSNFDGLQWRLALIDSATTSLDIQTYLWYGDSSGRLLLERAVLAARRGVKVRLIVDDLLLHGLDQVIANLDAQPNIEFRIFNPWSDRRSMLSRAGEIIAKMERLNTRMHDKLMIADGQAAIIGGRNIGDHYFGIHETYNFHDTDLMGFGAIAGQANVAFDQFWNSQWVVSAQNLTTEADEELAQRGWKKLTERNAQASNLASFPREVKNWDAELHAAAQELRIGRGLMVWDEAQDEQIDQSVIHGMFNFFSRAEHELLIMNAYVIPGHRAVDFMATLSDRGVDVRLLTNSLASHDVPAVNSHYEPWRDDLIEASVELYEFRADPAIQPSMIDVEPVAAGFSGLHSKSAVVDRRYVFIGSMNLDPRSATINTEMGVFVDSPELAEDMAEIILRDMDGANAWHVTIGDDGKLRWDNGEKTLDKQPARSGMQRVMNVLMKVGPKNQY